MSSRQNDFPVTSLSRSSGSRLQVSSQSSLASGAQESHSHPLLSPQFQGVGRPSSPTPSEISQHSITTHSHTPLGSVGANAALSISATPKYVPYTPRQRVTATAATTGATMHPSSSGPHHSHAGMNGDATSKLQMMHLKAAAQGIGLDSGTLGWMMLERLVMPIDGEKNEEWAEVWNAITIQKATLLLPLENAFTNEKITVDFMKDHIVLCDGPNRNGAPFITFSGLRGTLDDKTLTFRSSIAPSTKLFNDILNPTTRTSSLSRLPPLPALASSQDNVHPYPEFEVPSYSSALHLPPRLSSTTPSGPKPPLPPRRPGAGSIPNVGAAPTGVHSRITNPFASLFGASKPSSPAPVQTPLPVAASPPTSVRSLDLHSGEAVSSSSPVDIAAFTINRRITKKDVSKEVNKALKGEVKAVLSATGMGSFAIPNWVVDRVHDVTRDWYPFIKSPNSSGSPLKSRSSQHTVGHEGREIGGNGYVVNPIEETLDEAAEILQDFYLALEQDMRAGGTPFLPRRKDRDREKDVKEGETETEDEKREKRENDRLESENRIRDVMEGVERTITTLFYDRLFMQPSTDDHSHDEALSSRIAALNLLDLGLGHLGIEVPKEITEGGRGGEVNAVVGACGELLTQLNDCYAPADKATLLVAAHKVVVDGLSRLPPIRLISEDDTEEGRREKEGREDSEELELKTARPTKTSFTKQETEVELEKEADFSDETDNGSEQKESTLTKSSISSQVSDGTTLSPGLTFESSNDDAQSQRPSSKAQLELPSPPKSPTPVSGDVLLPFIIFAVVKSNPRFLVSNLLYTQRFRNQGVGGEESYCLINLMAVAEFLENVDVTGLGLGGEAEKVMSAADLTPIRLTRSPITAETPLEPVGSHTGSGIRNRVGQQVDAIADSANKVISGVVDSSFGILRSFMPVGNPNDPKSPGIPIPSGRTTPGTPKAGFGLLRRESGFSIASLAASLPMPIAGRSRANIGAGDEIGQQLVTVSRPSSVKSRSSMRTRSRPGSRASLKIKVGESDDDSDSEAVITSEDDDEEEEEEDDGDENGSNDDEDNDRSEQSGSASEGEGIDAEDEGAISSGPGGGHVYDARSIRSFENMLSASRKGRSKNRGNKTQRKEKHMMKEKAGDGDKLEEKNQWARKSLSDRLASVSALAGGKKGASPPPDSLRNSLLLQPQQPPSRASSPAHTPILLTSTPVPTFTSPTSLGPSPPASASVSHPLLKLTPPKPRFLECTPDDLRLSEVGELLREYRRLVEEIKAVGGFVE